MYFFVDSPTIITAIPEDADCIFSASADERFVAFCIRNQIYIHCQKSFSLLGYYRCKSQIISSVGSVSHLCWSDDGDSLFLHTVLGFLIIIILTVKKVPQDDELSNEILSPYTLGIKTVKVLKKIGPLSSFVSVDKKIIASNKAGHIFCLALSGDTVPNESMELHHILVHSELENTSVTSYIKSGVYCNGFFWAPTLGGLLSTLSDGRMVLFLLPTLQLDSLLVKAVWVSGVNDPTAVAVNNRFRLFAVGNQIGDIIHHRLDESSNSPVVGQTLSLPDSILHVLEKKPGAVRSLSWSPDGCSIAVSWLSRGLALWSVFGALLYTTLLDQTEVTRYLCPKSLCWTHKGFRLWTFADFLEDPVRKIRRENLAAFRSRIERGRIQKKPSGLSKTASGGHLDMDAAKLTDDKKFLMVFNLAKSALILNPTADNHLHALFYTPNTVLLCGRLFLHSARNFLSLPLPEFYAKANTPIRFVGLNMKGTQLAVAGRRGFTICSLASFSWRVFGNVSQEQSFEVHAGLAWWGKFVCFSSFNHSSNRCELRCYPSTENLDDRYASVFPLESSIRPLILDVVENHAVIFSTDCHYRTFSLSVKSTATAVRFVPRCTINLLAYIQYPSCVTRICQFSQQKSAFGSSGKITANSSSLSLTSDSEDSDTSLLILYAGDLLLFPNSSFALINASESSSPFPEFFNSFANRENHPKKYRDSFSPTLIASKVECLWIGCAKTSSSSSHIPSSGDIDNDPSSQSISPSSVPLLSNSVWISCGQDGLKIWFPLSLGDMDGTFAANDSFPASPTSTHRGGHRTSITKSTRRVMLSLELPSLAYPITILLDKALVITALNAYLRTDRSYSDALADYCIQLPWSTINIKTNLFLPHLLKNLLSKNLSNIAHDLAVAYQPLEYFQHILELLLHEVLEEEATSKFPIPDPLLTQVTAFIEQFPHFLDVIIQCTRKTEVTWWRHLYSSLGRRPKDIFDHALSANQLEIASSCLVVLQNSESIAVSKNCVLELLQKTLEQNQWSLVADLMRFLKATSIPAKTQLVGFAAREFPGSVHVETDILNEVDLVVEKTKCSLLRAAEWKRLEELFANMPSVTNADEDDVDAAFSVVSKWILRNRDLVPEPLDWPSSFLSLHHSFNWFIPLTSETINVVNNSHFATSSPTSFPSINGYGTTPPGEYIHPGTDAVHNVNDDLTFQEASRSCLQVNLLLTHIIAVAKQLHTSKDQCPAMFSWAILVSILALDRQSLFTLLSLIPINNTEDLSRITTWLEDSFRKSSSNVAMINSVPDSTLSRILHGIMALCFYFQGLPSQYSIFLQDLQPALKTSIAEIILKSGKSSANLCARQKFEEGRQVLDNFLPSLGSAVSCPEPVSLKITSSAPHSDTLSSTQSVKPKNTISRPNDTDSNKFLLCTELFPGQDPPPESFETTDERHLVNANSLDDFDSYRSTCQIS